MVALVKPMFELGLHTPPSDERSLWEAVARTRSALERHGWEGAGSMRSPILGRRGAVEFLLHMRRREGHPIDDD